MTDARFIQAANPKGNTETPENNYHYLLLLLSIYPYTKHKKSSIKLKYIRHSQMLNIIIQII